MSIQFNFGQVENIHERYANEKNIIREHEDEIKHLFDRIIHTCIDRDMINDHMDEYHIKEIEKELTRYFNESISSMVGFNVSTCAFVSLSRDFNSFGKHVRVELRIGEGRWQREHALCLAIQLSDTLLSDLSNRRYEHTFDGDFNLSYNQLNESPPVIERQFNVDQFGTYTIELKTKELKIKKEPVCIVPDHLFEMD